MRAVGVLAPIALTGCTIGCQPTPPPPTASGQPSAMVAAGNRQPAASSKPTEAGSARTTLPAACGLGMPAEPIELLPVHRGKVAISRSLPAVRLRGVPKLIAEPEDFAEYYLAEQAVDEASLPSRLQRLPSLPVGFLSDPEHCRGKLGKISAWAWADEQGLGWRAGAPAYNARRAFREGNAFLVADVVSECELGGQEGATLSRVEEFRRWQVRRLSEEKGAPDAAELIAKGLSALEVEPALAVHNAAYERYRQSLGKPLSKYWWSPPGGYVGWSYATSNEGAELLIVELELRLQSPNARFEAEWIGVWCIASDGALVSLGLDYLPSELRGTVTHYRHSLSVVGPPKTLPVVLYSHYALRPVAGRYQVHDYSLPAAPMIE